MLSPTTRVRQQNKENLRIVRFLEANLLNRFSNFGPNPIAGKKGGRYRLASGQEPSGRRETPARDLVEQPLSEETQRHKN